VVFRGPEAIAIRRAKGSNVRADARLPGVKHLVVPVVGLVLALVLAACGEPPAAKPTPKNGGAEGPQPRSADYPTDEGSWGKFHSKRFLLSVPLPDGKAWKIDDHSRPALFAVHDATSSKLWLTITQEDELTNRQKCEQKARDLGWVPSSPLTTVEEHVATGPDAYDSRIWVALDAGRKGGSLEGHVFLFGGFLRKCLLIHLATRVPSPAEEEVLSSRLALVRARMLNGIVLDPPRVTDDAAVPRDKPEVRR
jgi:hypothetical protein